MPDFSPPEWISTGAAISEGEDLLGLRLPVQVISGGLLDGVTTISPRARHLSLRAWIIKTFSESHLPNTTTDFNAFATRLETAVVLGIVLKKPGLSQVPGSTKATTLVEGGLNPIPCESLVDQPAFAAYAGPSYALGLSFRNPGQAPGLTLERGIPLAEAVQALIQDTEFYRRIVAEPLFQDMPRDILQEMGAALNFGTLPEREIECLLGAIIPAQVREHQGVPHAPEIMRIATYMLILELARRRQQVPSEREVFAEALAPHQDLPEALFPVLDGYLAYLVRDMLAVVHEAALAEICAFLGLRGEITRVEQVLHSLVAEPVDTMLRKLGLLTEGETIASLRFREFSARVEGRTGTQTPVRGFVHWDGDLDERNLVQIALNNPRGAVALLPVAWILCGLRVCADSTTTIQELSHLGKFRMGLAEVILPQLNAWEEENPALSDIIAWQMARTVDQHVRIAWSRGFLDPSRDVAVLVSDGEEWRSQGKAFWGGQTASRLPEAIDWMVQLRLVDGQGLTPEGDAILLRGHKALNRAKAAV